MQQKAQPSFKVVYSRETAHRCELPDPSPYTKGTIIECTVCGRMWDRVTTWFTRKPLWLIHLEEW